MQKIFKFIASLGLLTAFATTAATEQYTIYLDTDGVTTGQCAAAGLNGADAKIDITVNDSPKAITAVSLSNCSGSSYAAATSLSLSDWSLSVGTGVGGSDVIQGQIPLAQLGNPSQVQIIATSDVGGVVNVAGSTWAGLTLSNPTSTTVQSVPAVSTLAVGVLLLAIFAVSMMAYRRRYGCYHWLFVIVCLPMVLSLAWALTWTTVINDTQNTGNSGDIIQVKLANDSDYLHVQLSTYIGEDTEETSTDDNSGLIGTFLYNKSPQLNQLAEIFVRTDADTVQWSVLEQPSGASLNLTASIDTKTVTFTATQTGVYTIQASDSSGLSLDTTFRVSTEFPYDESKIVRLDPDEPLLDTIAEISNQYWVVPRNSENTDVSGILANYDKLSVLGADELRGTLIQIDESDLTALQQVEEVRLLPEIHYIRPRIYIGKNALKAQAVEPNDYGSNAWQTSDNAQGENWHLEKINMPEAWEIEQGSPDISIGICDAGYFDGDKEEEKHEDMVGRFRSVVTDAVGYDENGNITAEETASNKRHGMMTSGAIGAISNNGQGIAGINSISPIVATAYFSSTSINCLAELAADKKVKVMSFSMGNNKPKNYVPDFVSEEGRQEYKKTMNSARGLAYFMAAATESSPDKLLVKSAGNTSTDARYFSAIINSLGSVKYDNTIVVAAMGDNNRLVYYSNYGTNVDIAAPTHYKSVGSPTNGYWEGPYGTNIDDGAASGTSAAAPIVAGVASLIYSINPNFTGEDVKNILVNSASKTVKVSSRYTDEGGNAKPLSDFDAPEIPILDAKAALELAKAYTAGEQIQHTYWMQNAFEPTVTVKFLPYSEALTVSKVTVNGVEKASTFDIPNVGEQIKHSLTATIQYANNSTTKTIDTVLHVNKNIFTVYTEDSSGNRQPVGDADVRIYSFDPNVPGGQVLSEATTNASGQVTAYLTPGAYTVRVNASGYELLADDISENEKSSNTRMREMKLTASGENLGGIIGIVQNEAGEGVGDIAISVFNDRTDERIATIKTDSFGNYAFSTAGFVDVETMQKKNLPTTDSNGVIPYRLEVDSSLESVFEEGNDEIVLVLGKNVHRNVLLIDSALTPQPEDFAAEWQGSELKLSWKPLTDANVAGYVITTTRLGASPTTVRIKISDKTISEQISAGLSGYSYKFSIRAFRQACETLIGEELEKCAGLPSEVFLYQSVTTTASATLINDTGITACGTADDTSNIADCSTAVANATGSQVPLGQDGHYGTGKDGSKGMVFEKVSGYEDKCVLDKHTGLMWEVKTNDGGLHDTDNTYTWYSTTNNRGNAGTQNGGTCSGSDCDTAAFVDAVNSAGWCGYYDWRLPTRKELGSIVDYSRYSPAIDTTYFPQTQSAFYWSSSPDAISNLYARGVAFDYGGEYIDVRFSSRSVRLVRGGQ